VRVLEAEEVALESGKHDLSDLWDDGQRVMTELIMVGRNVA